MAQHMKVDKLYYSRNVDTGRWWPDNALTLLVYFLISNSKVSDKLNLSEYIILPSINCANFSAGSLERECGVGSFDVF